MDSAKPVRLLVVMLFLSTFDKAISFSVGQKMSNVRAISSQSYLSDKLNPKQGDDEYDGWTSNSDEIDLPRNLELRDTTSQLKENERDLFIPIFALVSLGGLVGAYSYEMLRLYLRGELYLPFMH